MQSTSVAQCSCSIRPTPPFGSLTNIARVTFTRRSRPLPRTSLSVFAFRLPGCTIPPGGTCCTFAANYFHILLGSRLWLLSLGGILGNCSFRSSCITILRQVFPWSFWGPMIVRWCHSYGAIHFNLLDFGEVNASVFLQEPHHLHGTLGHFRQLGLCGLDIRL